MFFLFNIFLIFVYYFAIEAGKLSKAKKRKIFCLASGIHLGAIQALRHPFIFYDNGGYAQAFHNISDYSFTDVTIGVTRYTQWGQGYVFFNWLLTKLTHDDEILFFLSGVIIVGCMSFLIYKTSYKPLLSIMIWILHPMLYYQSMYVLRQHIASIFLLLALYYYRKKIKTYLYFILAFLFHYSALVFSPFYLFGRFNFKRLFSYKIVSFAIVLIIVLRLSVGFVISLLPRFEYEDVGSRNIVPLIILGSLTFMHYINGNFSRKLADDDLKILQFLVFGVIISFFIIGLPGGGRLSNYFIYITPFAVPLLYKYNKKLKFANNIYVIFLFFLFSYLCYDTFVTFEINDYQFFWEKAIVEFR